MCNDGIRKAPIFNVLSITPLHSYVKRSWSRRDFPPHLQRWDGTSVQKSGAGWFFRPEMRPPNHSPPMAQAPSTFSEPRKKIPTSRPRQEHTAQQIFNFARTTRRVRDSRPSEPIRTVPNTLRTKCLLEAARPEAEGPLAAVVRNSSCSQIPSPQPPGSRDYRKGNEGIETARANNY